MAREEGEFELILGNKQLLSVLFIIIVLLGVFFAMGFLAGRSTSPKEVATANQKQGKAPLILEPGTKEAGQAEALRPSPAGEREPEPVKEAPRAAEPPKPEAVQSEAPKKEAARIPEPAPVKAPPAATPAKAAPPPAPALVKPAPAPAKPAPAPPKGGGFAATPPAGTYLQVAATRRPDAESMLAMLGKSCPGGYITPSPKSPELMRVILGPFPDSAGVAAARECIKKVGLEIAIVVKY
jgi:cell division septation protein DedD